MPHEGADNTQKILDVLADYGVKATFFVVGNWADQYPEQAKAIVDSGCELMNHSNAHDHYNSLTAEQIIKDVNTCNDKLEALTGTRPTLIRCPFGEYDDHVISAIRSIGMEPIQRDAERYHTAHAPAGACHRAGTGGDHYEAVNPYEANLISNTNLFISQYCAAKELDFASIALADMEQLLRAGLTHHYSSWRCALYRWGNGGHLLQPAG